MTNGLKIERGCFALGNTPQEALVKVSSTADFTISIWARNVETFHGGVQILTPPSQFRGPSSTGPQDGLVLDVPPQTGMDLGYIGARGNEVISISSAFGARVSVFLTVATAEGATVKMINS
jgi:hypothetical protein